MRIVVNDIAASSGGALTVLESFYRHVRAFGEDHEWVFLLGSPLLEETENIRTIVLPDVKRSWLRRLAFDFVTGGRLIASLKPDVVLSLQNTFTYGVGVPQVVYVHQSLPFQTVKNYSLWRRDERTLAVYQHVIGAVIKQSIRNADHIVVQTEWMRDAVLGQVRVSGGRVTSVLPDLEDLSAYRFDGTPDAGAFFYPTANYPYKNNGCVYTACRLARQQGVNGFTVSMTVEGPGDDPNVHAIGRVPRAQVLQSLARTTLIFPSYIETYGLPLAEARALGSIVLAADLPYAREVLRGYANAYFFDPASPEQLAALMIRVIKGEVTKSEVAEENETMRRPARTTAWASVVSVLEGVTDEPVGVR